MIIRDLKYAEHMAQIHVDALPNSFLASLGTRFLTLLYKHLIEDDNVVTLGIVEKQKLIGFITAGNSLNRVYFKLLKKPFLLWCSLFYSNVNLKKIRGIAELAYYTIRPYKNKASGMDMQCQNELYLLAIHPKHRRNGIASGLFENLMQVFLQNGIEQFKILVGEDLKEAQMFYEKHGAIKRRQFLYNGKLAIEYKKIIDY